MKYLKDSIRTSYYNWTTLFSFDIFNKILNYSFVYSITSELILMIIKYSNIQYLSFENLNSILNNPISIMLSIALIFIVVYSSIFEISAFFILANEGHNRRRIGFFRLLKETFIRSREFLRPENFILFVIFTFTTLLTLLPFSPYALSWFKIPDFITDYIFTNEKFTIIFGVFVIIFSFVMFVFLFAISHAITHNKSISNGIKVFFTNFKKGKIKTFLLLFNGFLAFIAVIYAIVGILILGLIIFTKLYYDQDEAFNSFIYYFNNTRPFINMTIRSLSSFWLFSAIISIYYDNCPVERSTEIVVVKPSRRRFEFIRRLSVTLSILVIMIFFSETELGENFFYKDYIHPSIVAHRAGAEYAPENTIAALDKAIEMKADMIETDVQQLKDGTLIIMHDNNFLRTAGLNKNVADANYDDIKALDAGSWFDSRFSEERIPTLDQYLERSKGKIKLMIELKLSGHEKNLVKEVLDTIEKHEMNSDIIIGSLNLNILSETKKINSQIKTVYITPLIFSNRYDIDYIDAYSVETSAVTKEMVSTVQFLNKEVYAWTANTKESIVKNINANVNGIVTDDVVLVRDNISRYGESTVLNTILEIFFDVKLND